ncbi:DUF4242 domain-containing protein [Piscinibacter sp. XHJ-5]|uniref:DUF4242 domain-containing protein n=1 Tax=Piscinibacter sp. XHJ-5 TaxID=3037797 RepID=UPI0024530E62|nr:DUF4242 domain-containing protein [Piscinibacter sp. XHJ-5]
MPRFLVERTFPHGLAIPLDRDGRKTCASVIAVNTPFQVTWIRSYVSLDGRRTFCLYEAPSRDAICQVADRNGLPVDRITEVDRLDPYPPIS